MVFALEACDLSDFEEEKGHEISQQSDYLQSSHTINCEYYTSVIKQLREEKSRKNAAELKLSKTDVLHQDNVPCHKLTVAMSAIHNSGFELLSYPLYSLDLAPSSFLPLSTYEMSTLWADI